MDSIFVDTFLLFGSHIKALAWTVKITLFRVKKLEKNEDKDFEHLKPWEAQKSVGLLGI